MPSAGRREVGADRLHHLLGDPAGAGRRRSRPGARRPRPPMRVRADQHPAAAVAVDRLGHQLADPFEHGRQLGRVGAAVGRHRVQQRPLAAGSRRSGRGRSSTSPCRRRRRCRARWPGVTAPAAAASSDRRRRSARPSRSSGRPARRPGAGRARRRGVRPRGDDPAVLDVEVAPAERAGSRPARPAAGARTRPSCRRRRTAARSSRRRGRRTASSVARSRLGGRVRVEQAGRAGAASGITSSMASRERDGVAGAGRDPDVVLEHPPAAEFVADQVEAHDRRPHGALGQPAGPPSRQPGERVHDLGRQHAVGERRRRRRRRPAGTSPAPGPAGPARPQSIAHSCAGMTRGTRSTGNGRCSPSTPNVMPAASGPGVALVLAGRADLGQARRRRATSNSSR